VKRFQVEERIDYSFNKLKHLFPEVW